MREISLSDHTYDRLLRRVESFEDSPDAVVERLLDEVERAESPPSDGDAERAPAGSLLPEGEYWQPILRIVADAGGSARAGEVIHVLEKELDERFTDLDRQRLNTGELRWKNRARFARLRMCNRGLLSDATRGVWAITEDGRRFLEEGDRG